jgi:hypothetical protein
MKILMIDNSFASGELVEMGNEYDLDEYDARALVSAKRAIFVDATSDAALPDPEPLADAAPKKSAKNV